MLYVTFRKCIDNNNNNNCYSLVEILIFFSKRYTEPSSNFICFVGFLSFFTFFYFFGCQLDYSQYNGKMLYSFLYVSVCVCVINRNQLWSQQTIGKMKTQIRKNRPPSPYDSDKKQSEKFWDFKRNPINCQNFFLF